MIADAQTASGKEGTAVKHKWLLAGLAGLLLGLTAGCSLHTPEELYTLPEPPAEYRNLNLRIQETMTALGAEYAAPLSGSNTQTVQLQDIDSDGLDEAIAFFRVSSDPKPLKVYIFKQSEPDVYSPYAVIEGEGTAIYSIAYEDLGGTSAPEVVVSWRMSEKVHSLAAYSLEGGTVTELMRTGYSGYRLIDIDMDNQREIVALQVDVAEGKSRAELYDYQEEGMVLCAYAPMSYEVKEITAVRSGYLRDSVRALFVSSTFGENNGLLTDIFAWRDGTLENITIDPMTGQSMGTMRYYNLVSGTDIDGDSVLEVPSPVALPTYQRTSVAVDFWTIDWRQYDIEGTAWPVCTTYHNVQDRWYLTLPESWKGQLTLSRKDNTVNGERAVVFSHWLGEETEPTPFLTIYRLTGANRELRSRMGNRFPLVEQTDTIYAAEFHDNDWDCGLDKESLAAGFHLIRTAWSAEN